MAGLLKKSTLLALMMLDQTPPGLRPLQRRVAASQTIKRGHFLVQDSDGLLVQAITTSLTTGQACVANGTITGPLYYANQDKTTGGTVTDADTMQVFELTPELRFLTRAVGAGTDGNATTAVSTNTTKAALDEGELYDLCKVRQGSEYWYGLSTSQGEGILRLAQFSAEAATGDTYIPVFAFYDRAGYIQNEFDARLDALEA